MDHDRSPASRAGGVRPATVQWRGACDIGPGIQAYTQFCALRTGRRFLTRSKQDRDLLLVVDTMPEIRDARLRPAVVTHWHGGVECRQEPWLWVLRGDVGEFWCCWKAHELAAGLDRSLRDQLLPLRIGLRNIVAPELLNAGRLELATIVRRHAKHALDELTREHARRLLGATAGPVLLQDVLHGRHPGLRAATVCRMIFDGAARLVPSDRPRPETRVVLNEPLNPEEKS